MRRQSFHLIPRHLASPYGELRVEVASESYQEYADWLEGELRRLEARWAHVAAPGRSRSPRSRFRSAKPE